MTQEHQHAHHQHGDGGEAEILDLDAEVLAEHTASITAWLPLQTDPRHIVDLGCGTGAGTFALLDRFPTRTSPPSTHPPNTFSACAPRHAPSAARSAYAPCRLTSTRPRGPTSAHR